MHAATRMRAREREDGHTQLRMHHCSRTRPNERCGTPLLRGHIDGVL